MNIKPQLAFVFPGQGSQSVGMLAELSEDYSVVKEVLDEASEVLGYDMWLLSQQGPEEQLNQTEFTQPTVLAADIAVWRCWQQEHGHMPEYMAGHSLGEYAALVCSEALQFTDALKLVEKRGRLMQQAVPEDVGAMAAVIGLSDEDVARVCEQAAEGEVVGPANFNSTGQVVIAGLKTAVLRAIDIAKAEGAKIAKLIPVSVPSHCALMRTAAFELREDLEAVEIAIPKIKVIQNVDAHVCEQPGVIREHLIEQLTNPVQWVATVECMVKLGVKNIIECGPGKVLMGLCRRITKDAAPHLINTPKKLIEMIEALKDE